LLLVFELQLPKV